MPLYDMKCTNEECKHEFEENIKLAEIEQAKCPKCGSKAERLITNPKHFKHGSWNRWSV